MTEIPMAQTAGFDLSSLSEVAEVGHCRAFVSEILSGGNALARATAEQQDRFVKYYTTIPAAAHANDFASGGWSRSHTITRNGVAAEPVASDDELLVHLLKAYVADAPTNLCILENTSARRGDPFIDRMQSPIAYADDSVLHVIAHGASNELIADAVREAKGIPVFIGVASEMERTWIDMFEEHSELSSEALRTVTRTARALLVGAYDGEGYVIGVPQCSSR